MIKPVIAAFDFDGTLTYSDTLIPFLQFSFGKIKTALKMIPLIPKLSLFLIGRCSRQEAKELILTQFLLGMPLKEVEKLGQAFAAGPLRHKLKNEALKKFEWHKQQGHTCILISANLSFYLSFLASSLGFDYLIASEAATDNKQRLTGLLKGINCYGPEKVRRLKLLLGNKTDYTLYAYGDSPGDKELLEIADYPYFRKF